MINVLTCSETYRVINVNILRVAGFKSSFNV